ncbi:MAG: hypothetical protein JXA73_08360 [Acidobacteria bacterium]|nr:hypothetical protein [Acidobacteriota bacterium]
MKKVCIVTMAILLWTGYAEKPVSGAPESQSVTKQDLSPEQIIRQFTQKESEFYEAWMHYMYRQIAVIRILSVNGVPTRETMRIESEVVFNDDGTREVKTVRTTGRLRSVGYSPEDKEIIENINPFALTAKDLPLYEVKYRGKEKADELDCYVFSVKPKKIKKGSLYFQGKIWVDDQDLQIVKTVGKAVPQTTRNKFPEFETIRQMIDGKYWFPVWTHADEYLHYPGSSVRIEETITYSDFRKFGSEAKIVPDSPTLSGPE